MTAPDMPPAAAEYLAMTDAQRAELRSTSICRRTEDGRCSLHGGEMVVIGNLTLTGDPRFDLFACPTEQVLKDVRAERARQFARYGTNEDTLDGTGPSVKWLSPMSHAGASLVESEFRAGYIMHEMLADNGAPTWMHLVREEIAEAFQEDDPDRLCEELIQVAALCVSWVEKKRAQQRKTPLDPRITRVEHHENGWIAEAKGLGVAACSSRSAAVKELIEWLDEMERGES